MKKYLPFIIVMLFAWGCASPYVPPDFSSYVWPKPPQKPRIKLVKILRTDLDIREPSAVESVFGYQAEFSFKKPLGVAADNDGNIYVSDTYHNTVFIINLEKKTINRLKHPTNWGLPGDIDVDTENGIIAAANTASVVLFDLKTREFIRVIGTPGDFDRTLGVALEPKGKILYISDSKRDHVYAYDYEGNQIAVIANPGTEPGQVFGPTGIDVDSQGRLFVVDTLNFRVQGFNPDGTLYKVFGEHGDRVGMFARPKSLAISRDNLMLVTDSAFGNFQIFDTEGNIYLFVGETGRDFGEFQSPFGIEVDDNDRIYVADSNNRRIVIFQMLTDKYYAEHPEERK